MRSTYARALAGSKLTAPPVKNRWIYLVVAGLITASALLARDEAVELLTDPIGVAVAIAVAAGFVVQRSMALTPWALVSSALVAYGIERATSSFDPLLAGLQLLSLSGAVVVSMFQLRVQLSGQAGQRPSRTRWGSVLVAVTASAVVLVLSRPDVGLLEWVRRDPVAQPELPPVLPSDYTRPVKVGALQDAAIDESSGLVASRRNPGVMWTHNDSGDGLLIYCLRADGAPCGAWLVTGAQARDWEDMAVGPGPAPGQSYLYVGDIGDNARERDAVIVYRFPEPEIDSSAGAPTTSPADAIRLAYPNGPHDAETLLVHPITGDLYIITKEVTSGVYRAAAPLDASQIITLERVARFSIFATLSDRTGGDISPDGRRVAIATYGGWYELVLPAHVESGSFDVIWSTRPTRIGTSSTGQTEAIAYGPDGATVYMTSEGQHTAILRAERRG